MTNLLLRIKENDMRNFGKFKITKELLDNILYVDVTHREMLNVLFEIFSKVIVLDARYDYLSDCMVYIAYSESFDSLYSGEDPPEYNIIIESCYTNGINKPRFKKFKKRI